MSIKDELLAGGWFCEDCQQIIPWDEPHHHGGSLKSLAQPDYGPLLLEIFEVLKQIDEKLKDKDKKG